MGLYLTIKIFTCVVVSRTTNKIKTEYEANIAMNIGDNRYNYREYSLYLCKNVRNSPKPVQQQ